MKICRLVYSDSEAKYKEGKNMKKIMQKCVLTLGFLFLLLGVDGMTVQAGGSVNVSAEPVRGNLSVANLPATANHPTTGYTYYLNISYTSDFEVYKTTITIKKNGSVIDRIVKVPDNVFYRYHPQGYTFQSAGTYTICWDVEVKQGNQYYNQYAEWQAEVRDIPIYLDANGGSVSPSSMSTRYGQQVTFPTPHRTGYDFDCWTDGSTRYQMTYLFYRYNAGNENKSVSLYALWDPKNYTVYYNANGGSVSSSSKIVTYDSTYGTLPTPTRTGYDFDGWYTSSSGGSYITSSSRVSITSSQTLYAHWSPKSYTVYYNGNGGSVSSSFKTVTYDSTYGVLPTPTRTGYDFDGWYTSSSGGSYITSSSRVNITSSQTLYAHWSPKIYTVYYNANGGSVSSSSKTVTYGSTYGTLPTPTRTGYGFIGWYTSAIGGSQITNSSTVSITANQTLYAHWTTGNIYTVSFDGNGGSVSSSSKTVTYGSTYGTLPTPTRTGYDFVGWYTSVSGGSQITSSSTVGITSNQTLYAHWSPKIYTLSYNGNGGSVSSTVYIVAYGSTYGTLPTPTRAGYDFLGWYTSAIGGSQITSSSVVSIAENHTLYAHWSPKTYIVTYNANGGSVSSPSKTVTYGSTYGTLPIPIRTGYGFAGWYTAATGGIQITSSSAVNITANQTLYAHWTTDYYTVSFHANGGTGLSQSSISVASQGTIGVLPTVTRVGYDFAGWYTMQAGGTKVTENTKITKTQMLYAHWTPKNYTVSYNGNGGAVSTSSKLVIYGSTYGVMPVPTRTGYDFAGWYTSANGGSQITAGSIVNITGNQTLYARWNQKNYIVKFDANGGSSLSSSSKTVTDNSVIGTLPTVNRSGYTFLGWYTQKSGGAKVSTTTIIRGSQTLYAHWQMTPPGSVSIKVKLKSANSVVISWNAVSGAQGYMIYRSNSENGTFTHHKTITSGSTVSYEHKKLHGGRTYYYKVRAYKMSGTKQIFGGYSKAVGKKVKGSLGKTNLKKPVINKKTKMLTLTWSADKDADKIEIYCRKNKEAWRKITTVSSSIKKAAIPIKAFDWNNSYTIRIRAYYVSDGVRVNSPYSNSYTLKRK